jgi:hypothetical protein
MMVSEWTIGAFAIIWIVSMIHMHMKGFTLGSHEGSQDGVAFILTAMVNAEVITEDQADQIFSQIVDIIDGNVEDEEI